MPWGSGRFSGRGRGSARGVAASCLTPYRPCRAQLRDRRWPLPSQEVPVERSSPPTLRGPFVRGVRPAARVSGAVCSARWTLRAPLICGVSVAVVVGAAAVPAVLPQDFGQVERVEVWIAAEALGAPGASQQRALSVWTHGAVCGALSQELLGLQLETEGKNVILGCILSF